VYCVFNTFSDVGTFSTSATYNNGKISVWGLANSYFGYASSTTSAPSIASYVLKVSGIQQFFYLLID
jgi:hypothetical protein